VEGAFSEDLYHATDYGEGLSGLWILGRQLWSLMDSSAPRLRLPKFNDMVPKEPPLNPNSKPETPR